MYARMLAAGAMGVMIVSAAKADGLPAGGSWVNPTLDRWNYPFGDASGTRTSASTFTSLWSGYTIFDDRDAEFLLGFSTGGQIATGFRPAQYRITAVQLTTVAVVADPQQTFVFDPTPDQVASFYDPGDATATPPRAADPALIGDPDAGRSVEVYGVAFRNGFTALTFAENTPFSFGAPAPTTRNAYPIDFGGAGGAARDVSNNVTQRFQPSPLAVGSAKSGGTAVAPGAAVTDGTIFTFDCDTADTGVLGYLRQGLAQGRLEFIVSSLHPATSFGSGPVSYPVWRTKEDPLATTSSTLTVSAVLCLGDLGRQGGLPGADGLLDNNDFVVFIDAFFAQNADVADIGKQGGVLGKDGVFDNNDFVVYINAFFSGC